MSREYDRKIIETLYPADSKNPEIAKIGETLFLTALAIHWREVLSDRMMATLRRLCETEEKFRGSRGIF